MTTRRCVLFGSDLFLEGVLGITVTADKRSARTIYLLISYRHVDKRITLK